MVAHTYNPSRTLGREDMQIPVALLPAYLENSKPMRHCLHCHKNSRWEMEDI